MAKEPAPVYGVSLVGTRIYVVSEDVKGETYIGKAIKTPIGDLHTIFCNKHAIGRMLNCPYVIAETNVLPRSRVYRLSTVCNQYIYVDKSICIYGSDAYLIAGLAADYALDGDNNRT
jgi:hypothetical protein